MKKVASTIASLLAVLTLVVLAGCGDPEADAPIEGEVKSAPEGTARPEGAKSGMNVDPNF